MFPFIRHRAPALLVALIVLVVRVVSAPRTVWELDETLFALGVERFKPLAHHPHPPGYPLTIAFGKIVHLFGADPFRSLQIVSIIASVLGAWFLAAAFGRLLSSDVAGACGALLFHLSPGMLIHAPLALSDAPALLFVSVAVWALSANDDERIDARNEWVAGAAMSAAIGCRPQYALFLLPLLAATLVIRERRRKRWALLISFAAASLLWFVPLVVATGGVPSFLHYELAQGRYVTEHDAQQSRSGWSAAALLSRFLSHPWGTKLMALPVLTCALGGLLVRSARGVRALPLVLIASFQLLVCLTAVDPADGVRYALPVTLAVAFFAAAAISRVSAPLAVLGTIAFGSAAVVYTWPVVILRIHSDSPPVAAAKRVPRGAVVGFVPSLRGHCEYLLSDRRIVPIDGAMGRYGDAPNERLFVLREGTGGDQVFAWSYSDAYGKLTRNRYRVISLSELPPERRFIPVKGVFGLESDETVGEWRWLRSKAELALPSLGGNRCALTLSLPADTPLAWNVLTVRVNGVLFAATSFVRGERKELIVPITGSGDRITLSARKAAVPERVSARRHDRRELALRLLGVRQFRVQ